MFKGRLPNPADLAGEAPAQVRKWIMWEKVSSWIPLNMMQLNVITVKFEPLFYKDKLSAAMESSLVY